MQRPHDAPDIDETAADPRPRPDDERDQGGDPACWAHLFEEVEAIE